MSNDTKDPSERTPSTPEPPVPIRVREAEAKDIPALVSLMLRLKRLNEEFDPLLKVRPDAEQKAREILEAELQNPKGIVLAAEGSGADREKVVGVVRAAVRERPFYIPEQEGVILDIYLLPLYRRKGVGEYLLQVTADRLKQKGAGIVTADFPFQNEIAARFYAKRGFRPITALHARSI